MARRRCLRGRVRQLSPASGEQIAERRTQVEGGRLYEGHRNAHHWAYSKRDLTEPSGGYGRRDWGVSCDLSARAVEGPLGVESRHLRTISDQTIGQSPLELARQQGRWLPTRTKSEGRPLRHGPIAAKSCFDRQALSAAFLARARRERHLPRHRFYLSSLALTERPSVGGWRVRVGSGGSLFRIKCVCSVFRKEQLVNRCLRNLLGIEI